MSKKRAERKFPQLAHEDAKYYSVFYEGQHDDSRTNTYIALTAAEEGATVANYVEMIDIIKNDDGKAIGVKAKDNLTGDEFDIHAKVRLTHVCDEVQTKMSTYMNVFFYNVSLPFK